MALRKAIGAVKDQTSIGIAKVASNLAPELEVAVVKATGHDNDPASEKYIRNILQLTTYSRGYVSACVVTIAKRLGKTRDWVVALKCLMLIHRLLNEGDVAFQHEIMYATRRGTRLLNLSDFRDEAHSSSWDHSAFVRTYALFLDQKLELMAYDRKQSGKGGEVERFGGRHDRPNNRSPTESSRGRDYNYGRDERSGYRSPHRGYDRDHERSGYRSPHRGYDHDHERSGYGSPHRGYDHDHQRSGYRSPPGTNRGYNHDFNGYHDEPSNGMRRSRSSEDARESANDKKDATPLRELSQEKIFGKMSQMQRLLDRFLACRPTGLAKNERMILVAVYAIVRESFKLYADVCEALAVLLDKFFDMEHQDSVKAFVAYGSAAKQIDELIGFYNWCKDTGLARASEFPEVQRITDKLLETLEEFVRDRSKVSKSPEMKVESMAEEPVQESMNEVKALPPPENTAPPPPAEPELPKPAVKATTDLVDLREVTADDQGNKLALALFAGPAANNGNGSWEAFPTNGEAEVSSAWQNPAAEAGKADWELALVESTSHLSKQKATMGGGLDSLLLNGMYDQGMVQHHTSTTQLSGGSGSSVALPGPGTNKTPVLALPAPDGTIQTFGEDPFAASLSIQPPAYVQMADMEKKQGLLAQEQMVWQQYSREGMQGQTSLAKIGNSYGPTMPPHAGYTYAPF